MRLLGQVLLAATLAWSAGSGAQAYPNKPIRWIIPYTPGGLTDNVTRLVTQRIQEQKPVGNTPAQTGKFLEDEIAKWSKVITTAGVKVEQ